MVLLSQSLIKYSNGSQFGIVHKECDFFPEKKKKQNRFINLHYFIVYTLKDFSGHTKIVDRFTEVAN